MMLIEQSSVPATAIPVAALTDHLMMGTGFSGGTVQDVVLENFLRAAISAIEARTGKVLMSKQYTWTLTAWREPGRQPLPLAPVSSIDGLRLIDRNGQAVVISPATWRLEPDDHRPALRPVASSLPPVPMEGSVEIDFTAGYGPAWSDVPADLAQAVLLLAAHYYDNRHATGASSELPFGVSSLIERYRNVRILGGGVQ